MQMLTIANHDPEGGGFAAWQLQPGDQLLLNKIMGVAAVHQHDHLVAGDQAQQAQRFWSEVTRQRIETNLGRARVTGVRLWFTWSYKRQRVLFFVCDQQKNPRGTTVASMVFLVTGEAETSFPARGYFVRGEALQRRRWRTSRQRK